MNTKKKKNIKGDIVYAMYIRKRYPCTHVIVDGKYMQR